jgi:hypothetical protein
MLVPRQHDVSNVDLITTQYGSRRTAQFCMLCITVGGRSTAEC